MLCYVPHTLPTAQVGEYALVMEMGIKAEHMHHHGQLGVECLSAHALELVVKCCELCVRECLLLSEENCTCVPNAHDKGDNRTKEEHMGYCLKKMPKKELPDGRVLPYAEQGVYYRDPAPFLFFSNMSIDRCRECIKAYQQKNQQTGGENFAKSVAIAT